MQFTALRRLTGSALALVVFLLAFPEARQLPPPPPPPPPPAGGGSVTTTLGPGGVTTTTTTLNSPVPSIFQTGTGIVVGRVLDSVSNRPVAGAIVTVGVGPAAPPAIVGPGREGLPSASGRPPVPRVVTDSEGRFAFRNLPAGSFSLTATRPGYSDSAYGRVRPQGPSQPLQIADGERKTDVTLRLFKLGAITGRVTDDSGEPVAGISVTAFRRTVGAGFLRMASATRATTDDRGIYRIGSLVAGDYAICVTFASTSAAVGYTSNADFISTVVTPGAGGYSISSGGTRIAGFEGFVLQSVLGTTAASVDGNGRPVGYGNACHPTSATIGGATVVSLGPGAERTGIDVPLRLTPLVFVSGTVTSAEGPAANYVLHLVAADSSELSNDLEVAQAITSADGSFVFLGVPAGQYVIQTVRIPRPGPVVTARGGGPPAAPIPGAAAAQTQSSTTWWTATPITVGRTDIRNVGVVLQRGMMVSGRVEFEGASTPPQPNALTAIGIALEPADGKPRTSSTSARVTADGTFSTTGVPAGHYLVRTSTQFPGWTVKAVMAGGVDASDTPIDLTRNDIGGVRLIYTDRPTKVSGTVKTASGDTASSVIVFPIDPQAWQNYGVTPRRMRLVRAGAGGEFTFTGLPAGEYYLAAIDDAIARDWQDPRFLGGVSRQALRISLADGGQVTQQLDRLNVRPPSLPEPAPLFGDDDRGHGPFVSDEEEPQARDAATLPASGTAAIGGRVLLEGPGEEPVKRARVIIRASNSNFDFSALTDEQGRFLVERLPAARYSITVNKAAFVPTYHGSLRPGRGPGTPIELADGARRTDITVRMQRGAVISGTVTDETGQPVPNAVLRIWQLLMAGSERRLVGPASGPTSSSLVTDDRGEYRIFGLTEGTYYVSAGVSGLALGISGTSQIHQQSNQDLRSIESEAARAAQATSPFQPMGGRAVGYTSIFHPSSVTVDSAAGVVLSPGMERAGVDIVLRLVPTVVVRGRVIGSDGQPSAAASVMIATYETGGVSIGGYSQVNITVAGDGSFSTAPLTPGRYTLLARGALSGTRTETAATSSSTILPLFGAHDFEVTGDDIPEVTLTLSEGSKVRGKVMIEGDAPSEIGNVRVNLAAANPSRMAAGAGSATPASDGTFVLEHVAPGEYRTLAFIGTPTITSGRTSQWLAKSVMYQGRDVLDTPFEVQRGVDVDGLTVVFTNKMPELSGTITDAAGRPRSDLTIVLFSTNKADWRPGTRRVMPPVQPDTAGRFLFASVPAGEYYLAAVAAADRNDLADTSFLEAIVPAALRLTIADGDKKVQDLRVKLP